MTRPEALIKLLRLGPISRDEIPRITGWGTLDTLDELDALTHQRKIIRYRHADTVFYRLAGTEPTHYVKPRRASIHHLPAERKRA
jgi:hypothetical protein